MTKLLIIDDDVTFARVLERAMTTRQYDVKSCHTLADAVTAARSHRPAFVLLDVNIHGDNGLSLIPELKTVNPHCRIVVLTSYGTLDSAVWAARNGADEYITKPADADEIDHVLRRCAHLRLPLPDVLPSPEDAREAHIVEFYEKNDRRVATTARMLGLHRRTLQRTLERLGLNGNAGEFARTATAVGRAKRIMRLWSHVLVKRKATTQRSIRSDLRRPLLSRGDDQTALGLAAKTADRREVQG